MQCIPELVEIIRYTLLAECSTVKILKRGERSNREIDCCPKASFFSVVKAVNVSTVIIGRRCFSTELIFSGSSREISAPRGRRDH